MLGVCADIRFKFLSSTPSVFQHRRPPGYGTTLGRSGFLCGGTFKPLSYGLKYVLKHILTIMELWYICVDDIQLLFCGMLCVYTHPQGRFCCVLWCSTYTLTLGHIRHAKNASWRHAKHPKPCPYDAYWFLVPSLAIALFLCHVIDVPPNQFSACHVHLVCLLCWSPPIKCTRHNTIRPSSDIHPPAIRVVIPHRRTITIVYCCVIIAGCTTQNPEVHHLMAWRLQ